MPPFTYPRLLLASHGAITVLQNLQLFLRRANDGATCAHCFMGSSDGGL
jgi:hypothetical protein